MIRTIIFDFDGTIVDSGRVVFDLFNKFADKYDYKRVPERDAELIRSLPVRERFKMLKVPVHKVPLLTMDVVRKYKEAIPNLKISHELKNVLKELKNRGVNLILISANSKENIKQFLKINQMEWFDDVITANRFFGRHLAINSYLKTAGISRDDVVFVGDEHRDILACRKSQIKIISVTWGYDLERLLRQSDPDYIARKPSDILNIIAGASA
ncbi:HAD hydrolase-like protein [Paenibacillus zanthoxyli]|uniref:HAD hydrolase-like protein n=1 Tax=Paenibacillus zanthoxyli TaxID=369399 RepID=UPI0004715322|nr:HAD hydrolase-like protein [Paenibacillus zanthoxyli]